MTAEPVPSVIGPGAPAVIRKALLPEEVGDFDREYRQVMTEATEARDLTPVLQMLERWRRVALSSRDEPAHRRMLDAAERLRVGGHTATESWDATRRRLGLEGVYRVETDIDALPEVEALPQAALSRYAEVLSLLEIAP
jgi:Family of unknown function (DUF6247)